MKSLIWLMSGVSCLFGLGCATGGHSTDAGVGRSSALNEAKAVALVGSDVVPTVSLSELDSKSLALCREIEKKAEVTDGAGLIEIAKSCSAQKNWSATEKVAYVISRLDINSGWGAYFLSLAAEGQGQFDRSLWMVELAMKKSSNATLFSYQRARVLWQLDRKSEAVSVMRKVVDIDSRLVEGQVFLGKLALQNQEWKEAKSYFTKAIEQKPKLLLAHMALSELYVSQNDTDAAVAQLTSAIAVLPDMLEPRLAMAQILERQEGANERALQAYRDLKLFLQSHPETARKNSLDVAEKIRSLENQTRKPALTSEQQAQLATGGVQ